VLGVALAIAMFPVVSIVGPLFDVWRRVGLYDTWAGLVLPYLSFALPLAIWVLTAHFREIPRELEEAAALDGASRWGVLRHVVVPLAAPGVFTAGLLTFLAAWNDFVFGISLTSTDRARPVPAALAFFSGASWFQEPAAALSAAAVVVTVPVVVVVLIFQRRIVAGLTGGAVKG
jgi:multiple sugar transport system permease protein